MKLKDLSFVDINYDWTLEAGDFAIQINSLSDTLKIE